MTPNEFILLLIVVFFGFTAFRLERRLSKLERNQTGTKDRE
jgi:hypothetical protein